jgi:hypothetical protein
LIVPVLLGHGDLSLSFELVWTTIL